MIASTDRSSVSVVLGSARIEARSTDATMRFAAVFTSCFHFLVSE